MAKLADLLLSTGATKPFSFKAHNQKGEPVETHVLIKVLTQAEFDSARENGRRYALKLSDAEKSGQSDAELLEDARIVETLALALRDPDKTDEIWAPSNVLRAKLSSSQIGLLWDAYLEHQDTCSPRVQDLTPQALDALIEQVAKEGLADPFLKFAPGLRSACFLYLAREVFAGRTAKSSQPSDTSEDSQSSNPSPSDDDESIDFLREQIADLFVRVTTLEGERTAMVPEAPPAPATDPTT